MFYLSPLILRKERLKGKQSMLLKSVNEKNSDFCMRDYLKIKKRYL